MTVSASGKNWFNLQKPFEVKPFEVKILQNLPRRNTGNGVHYCISHPFKRRNWCFDRLNEFLLSRLFFCFMSFKPSHKWVWSHTRRGCSKRFKPKKPDVLLYQFPFVCSFEVDFANFLRSIVPRKLVSRRVSTIFFFFPIYFSFL
jgi:hypothetical protein